MNATFEGDDAAFVAVNPIDLLHRQQFPGTAGAFVVGADDHRYRLQTETNYDAGDGCGDGRSYSDRAGWSQLHSMVRGTPRATKLARNQTRSDALIRPLGGAGEATFGSSFGCSWAR